MLILNIGKKYVIKYIILLSGGGGGAKREFVSGLWPPYRVSPEHLTSISASQYSGISSPFSFRIYPGAFRMPFRYRAERSIPLSPLFLLSSIDPLFIIPSDFRSMAVFLQALYESGGQRIGGEVSRIKG